MSLQSSNVLLLVILVVQLLAGNAHALPRSIAQAKNVTSLETATATATASLEASLRAASAALNAVKHNLLNLEAQQSPRPGQRQPISLSSSVQDWSLVCKELCGAGLIGLPCAGLCSSDVKNVTQNSNASSTSLLPSEVKKPICMDLCRLQIAATECHCNFDEPLPPLKINPEKQRDLVCHSFCVHSNLTIHGCSQCKSQPDELNQFELTPSGVDMEDVSVTMLTEFDASKEQNSSQGSSVNIIMKSTQNEEPTPDWNELCKSLCKTGDGGSLCNCDLSPF